MGPTLGLGDVGLMGPTLGLGDVGLMGQGGVGLMGLTLGLLDGVGRSPCCWFLLLWLSPHVLLLDKARPRCCTLGMMQGNTAFGVSACENLAFCVRFFFFGCADSMVLNSLIVFLAIILSRVTFESSVSRMYFSNFLMDIIFTLFLDSISDFICSSVLLAISYGVSLTYTSLFNCVDMDSTGVNCLDLRYSRFLGVKMKFMSVS